MGRAQARELSQTLAGSGVQLIVSSHLTRARETATLLHEALGLDLPLIVDPRLAETHRGEWETRRFSSIMIEDPETWRHYREHPESFQFPGGESLASQQRRVLACLRDCILDGRHAVLVTHGGSIRLARCFAEKRDIRDFHTVSTDNGTAYELPTDGLAERIAALLAR